MSISCFDASAYQKYLADRLPIQGKSRGLRAKLAQALGVQSAFVSRVLHGEAHFSLEHGVVINRFLEHTEAEAEFFLLLLQMERAGSQELRAYFQKQIDRIQEKRQLVAERIQVPTTMSAEDQMTYYSTWHYAAVHVMLLVPRWHSPRAIADYLHLPLPKVMEVLEFLSRTGLAEEKEDEFRVGKNRIHLGKGSPILPRHHGNWRMRAMQAMDRRSAEDLFYSGPICLSEGDALRVKELLLKLVEESERIIGPSPEEAVFCLGLDFFRL